METTHQCVGRDRGSANDGLAQIASEQACKGINPTIKCPSRIKRSIPCESRLMYKIQRRFFTIFLLSWLIMNADPAYPQRARNSMQAAGLLRRSFTMSSGLFHRRNNNNGLSPVEAIALIHAMNSNPRHSSTEELLSLLSEPKPTPTRQGLFSLQTQASATSPQQRQQTGLERQVPVPVPVPVPAPFAALAAAAAAFFAAVFAGFTPFAAAAAAAAAAFAAFAAAALLVILAAFAAVPKAKKQAPIIKKLVIKKTVLPFVIPIPFKKKEKEVVYKYIPKPVHIYHEEKKKKKKHYMYKKSDDNFSYQNYEKYASTGNRKEAALLDNIQGLLSEQDKIQLLVDDVVKNNKTSPKELADLFSEIETGTKRVGLIVANATRNRKPGVKRTV